MNKSNELQIAYQNQLKLAKMTILQADEQNSSWLMVLMATGF